MFVRENKEIYIETKESRDIFIQKLYTLNKELQSAGFLKSRYKSKKRTADEMLISDSQQEIEDAEDDGVDLSVECEWLKHNKTPPELVI